MTKNRSIIVFRDRSRLEIRDIYFSRRINNKWTKPAAVYNDNWLIIGCLVNGPKVVSNAKNTADSWFPKANEQPTVKISFLSDTGSFLEPINLNDVEASGRVDITFINADEVLINDAYLVWTISIDKKNQLKSVRFNLDGIK
jgi:hypothetical protein